uniref:Putative UDP-glycosyltransferase 87A1-like n=1 Tax=Davidia involucrata TaxID=16924 RepID=A0A5B6YSN5_DAVIN
MGSAKIEPVATCHMVALPYPGRGHINPMMNLCKLLASRSNHLLITFVVTEEWLGFIGSESKPANIRFATIPNVLPSELVRGADMIGFVQATLTKMEEPFEQLLDQLDPPVSIIMADTFLFWTINVGNQRNIPVASLWPMPASVFSIFYHFDLFVQNGHFPVDLSGRCRFIYTDTYLLQ